MVKCPYCGESYYSENYSTSTCLGWTPVYKNGVLMNENPNTTTTHCTCLSCGKSFSYSYKEYPESELSTSLDSAISWKDADLTSMPIL